MTRGLADSMSQWISSEGCISLNLSRVTYEDHNGSEAGESELRNDDWRKWQILFPVRIIQKYLSRWGSADVTEATHLKEGNHDYKSGKLWGLKIAASWNDLLWYRLFTYTDSIFAYSLRTSLEKKTALIYFGRPWKNKGGTHFKSEQPLLAYAVEYRRRRRITKIYIKISWWWELRFTTTKYTLQNIHYIIYQFLPYILNIQN